MKEYTTNKGTKITVESIVQARFVNPEKTMISCLIKVKELGPNAFVFNANKNDSEKHGQDIFNDLIAGAYGEISPYVPPVQSVK